MNIAIVTDSTCDLPPRLVAEAGIHVVPVPLTLGQETYLDGIDISRQQFYERLPSLPDLPKTASPAPGTFEQLYRRLLDEADAVVSVHVAATLSGTCNAASVGAGATGSPERITIVDSGQLSMGLGWAVLAAAEANRAGERLPAILERVAETLKKVRVFAIFNTMEFLLKGGRVSWLRAHSGDLLQIKPMVELRDGAVLPRGRVRKWARAVEQLAGQVRQLGGVRRLALMHSNCPDCVKDLLTRIDSALPSEPPLTVDVTPVIGTHVGPHALGFAALLEDNQQTAVSHQQSA